MPTPKQNLARRQMHLGFNGAKNEQGETIGASQVHLRKRNAYELIGLHRPQPIHQLRIKREI